MIVIDLEAVHTIFQRTNLRKVQSPFLNGLLIYEQYCNMSSNFWIKYQKNGDRIQSEKCRGQSYIEKLEMSQLVQDSPIHSTTKVLNTESTPTIHSLSVKRAKS